MSKSVKKVRAEAEELGLTITIEQTEDQTRTAQQAADYVGCHVDQIGKSILIAGAETGQIHLFLTPGGRTVDLNKAAKVMGEETTKADAAQVRAVTGFAIGGVSPIGHVTKIAVWTCPELLEFDQIWVAAGTPHHLFKIDPKVLNKAIKAKTVYFLQEI
ncbi:MAG: YbaK/EbsC family protein [Pseudomonadota bacterium]